MHDCAYACRTGCDSLHSIAVYLRFQLPPMHLANWDCVSKEMQSLMGVSGKRAKQVIEDLNVNGASFWVVFVCVTGHDRDNRQTACNFVHPFCVCDSYKPRGTALIWQRALVSCILCTANPGRMHSTSACGHLFLFRDDRTRVWQAVDILWRA